MEEQGYASITILNYVKYINKYLDYVGASDIRFNRGKGKDISGMTFGYLIALEPTDKRDRKDIVWRCQCKCGNIVELPATRLLVGNTLSCGCLLKEHFRRANMYIDNTSLRQALQEKVESVHSVSGYTGVNPKRDKWQAYEILKSRMEVFMLEQEIHCLDMDDVDYRSRHCFLEAEGRVVGFYEKFGFRTVSGEFLEEGIPHVTMELEMG